MRDMDIATRPGIDASLVFEVITRATSDADELMAVGIHRLAGEQTYEMLERATYVP